MMHPAAGPVRPIDRAWRSRSGASDRRAGRADRAGSGPPALARAGVGGRDDASVYALQWADGALYVGGLFSVAGGAPASNIARWSGSAWSALGAGTDGIQGGVLEAMLTMVLLAELLLDTGRRDEARGHLAAALTAPADPDWAPEDQRFKARAKALLAGFDTRPR